MRTPKMKLPWGNIHSHVQVTFSTSDSEHEDCLYVSLVHAAPVSWGLLLSFCPSTQWLRLWNFRVEPSQLPFCPCSICLSSVSWIKSEPVLESFVLSLCALTVPKFSPRREPYILWHQILSSRDFPEDKCVWCSSVCITKLCTHEFWAHGWSECFVNFFRNNLTRQKFTQVLVYG